ncbi:HD domain-containing protein [Aquipuribacter sp. SD81]|uniref:HD domain-containing protein n=1 Tax=Aquipuribacter sp. SD81 TaxID=3127703 RepID=UPI0030186488
MTSSPAPGSLADVLVRLGADRPGAEATEADLLARWSEPHRRYHDRRHLAEVVERVERLVGHTEHPDLVRAAAWWHDAVHDGRAGDDERASAALAREQLAGIGVAGRHTQAVADLVLVTADHDPGTPADPDAAVLCDADLGILASPPQRYAQYAADVREEYGHVPDELFAAGRAAVLRRLLSRRLFRSPGAAGWEETARANVGDELRRLLAGSAVPAAT